MQQYGNNGRPYGQNRDSLRSSGSSQRTTPPNDGASDISRYGFNGEPLSRPPARTANGTVRRTRTDNSIEFPTQPRPVRDTGSAARRPAGQRSTAQRPRSSGGQNRRPAQRPANRNGRPAQNSRSAARQQQQGQGYNKNQKLRPAPQRDAQRREGRKKRRLTRAAIRRRRMLRRLATFGLLLCVIGIGMYLTVTMLFRISAIQVQTADGTQVTEIAGYSADSILQTLGVQVEENIFSFDPGAKAAELERQYPLLESIRVVRDYPNTVVVQVTEATPTYAVQAGSSVTRIEFADTEQIAFLYQDRISVLLGTLNDLDYKLDRARYMLNNEDGKGCAATDTGRLDFSHVSAGSTRKIYFAQGDPVLPSGYVVPEKVEPETPEETADSSLTDEEAPQAAPAEDTTPEEIPLTDPARMTANEDENPM